MIQKFTKLLLSLPRLFHAVTTVTISERQYSMIQYLNKM